MGPGCLNSRRPTRTPRVSRWAGARFQRAGPTLRPSPTIRTVSAKHFYYARQYDAAIDQYHKALEIDPDFWVAHLDLGHVYAQTGQYDQATAQFQKVRQLQGANLNALASLGHLYGVMGRAAEARQVLDELKVLSQQRYIPPYYFAMIHAAVGENDQALFWLQKAYADRSQVAVLLRIEPMFDSLRSEPRFQKIIADMNFPP